MTHTSTLQQMVQQLKPYTALITSCHQRIIVTDDEKYMSSSSQTHVYLSSVIQEAQCSSRVCTNSDKYDNIILLALKIIDSLAVDISALKVLEQRSYLEKLAEIIKSKGETPAKVSAGAAEATADEVESQSDNGATT